jgi:L-fuculose-phosphate aldolase
VAPYATFGSLQLAHNVTAALQGRTAVLMGNHGAALVGDDLAKVLGQVAYLEYICDVQLRVFGTGRPARLLEAEEIERVRVGLSDYGQQPNG